MRASCRIDRAHVDLVADLVGVENPVVDQRRIDLVIQRDEVTEEWRARFRAENGDPNVLDDLFPDLPSFIRKVCFGYRQSIAMRQLLKWQR
jgi:hypothetical protein